MSIGIDEKVLKDTLAANQYYSGAFGPSGEAPLTTSEKFAISGKIAKDLREDHEAQRKELGDELGDQFFSEQWMTVRDQIAKAIWNKKGMTWYAIWGSIRSKSRNAALTKVGKSPLKNLSKGMFKK